MLTSLQFLGHTQLCLLYSGSKLNIGYGIESNDEHLKER